MPAPLIDGRVLQEWVEQTTDGWRKLVARHPDCLSFPCDIRETKSVGELLQHVVAVELRFAERLAGLAETAYEAIAYDSGEAVFSTHDRAMLILKELKISGNNFWDEEIDFRTRSAGTLRASRRSIYVHLLTHSIRHYAQLATHLRQGGVVPDFPMDFIFVQPATHLKRS